MNLFVCCIWIPGICLLYNPGELACTADRNCPSTVSCAEERGVCVSPADTNTHCQTKEDCGTLAMCSSEGSCEQTVTIVKQESCTERNDCGVLSQHDNFCSDLYILT